jgi:hypothetical protein
MIQQLLIGRRATLLLLTLLALTTVRLHADDTITVVGTTPTQALVTYASTADNVPCRIEVSEREDFSSLVPDVNPSLFPDADQDSRSLIRDSATRLVVIGTRAAEPANGKFHSRALRSATRHFVRVTCGERTLRAEFHTTETAGIAPDVLPFHAQGYGNMAVPDFDWTNRNATVVDPQTGVTIQRIGDPRDYSSNTSHLFPAMLGADGWSNPANALSGVNTQLTSTSNTNPALFIVNSTDAAAFGGFPLVSTPSHPITDMAIRFLGRGDSVNPEHRTVSVCLTVDSGQNCHTDWVDTILPSGFAVDVGLTPSTYPNPVFGGWSRAVSREFFSSTGFVSASAGKVTLIKDDGGGPINGNFQSAGSRFHLEWRPGSRIFINGSAPTCANNYCTITGVQSMTELTIGENLTLTDRRYRFAGLGFLVRKKTNVGTVAFSASYNLVKSFVMHAAGGQVCSSKPVETTVSRTGEPLGRTVTGYLCVFAWMFNSGGRLYFVGSSEPDVRFLSLIRQPTTIPGHANSDIPNAIGGIASSNTATFDPVNPNVFYTGLPTFGASFSLFRLTYTGDYRENTQAFFASSIDSTPAAGANNITWENVSKQSEGRNIRNQILARGDYDESRWGPLSTSLRFVGFTQRYAVFSSAPVGGSETPCWLFIFNANNGNYVRGWNTLNGGGEGALAGGCHAISTGAGRVLVSNNGLRNSNSNSLYGGPFESTIVGLQRNGVMSSNTALPQAFDGSYDGSCPADLAQRWKDMGAVGNECVTIKITSEPCSSFATANERTWTPCPSNPNHSWVGSPIGEGQQFYDAGTFFDNEHLMVVRRRNLTDGIELVLLRDAAPGYCCQIANPRGRICFGAPAQNVHQNGWRLRMVPKGSCGSVTQVYDPSTGLYLPEEQNLIRGHGAYQELASGNHSFAGIASFGAGFSARYDVPPTEFGKLGTSTFALWPRFAGLPSDLNNAVQSYISLGGADASPFDRKFASDWRHPNGSIGVAHEGFGQTIGQPYTIAKEPGTSSVYRVSRVNGTVDVKRAPIWVWVGRYILLEKSGPETGDTLTDADTWRFCYALRANECRQGSTPNSLYVNAPGLEESLTQCHASQISYRTICAFGSSAVLGKVMQLRIDQNDPTGANQRSLGIALTQPGSQYVYTYTVPSPDGKSITTTAWNLGGVYSLPIQMRLPPWRDDSVNRTTFVPVQVQAPGASHIEFGYQEFGAPENMFCTPRKEVCKVSQATVQEQNPFRWNAEPLAPPAPGGSIAIPAIPGRMLYYRVVIDGNPGQLNVVPVP